ncbi:hypothetical protein GCM10017691_26850 [Pseudonocardia petroleophila]|uniref:Glyceraldehyde 3-phosphate dehydrogenase NAD(P) binding domain-containing protein n=1 Tax=Pseudonocardia petroleophila TaxID=37331 RepID=A0A7G7MF55_9PSEU|nr:type I glyceraldehyde-3-phosphate dehydrogenase [Pseudonocardia petroleophila]QNG51416.1 hypothetical protein H6H00_25275 [Pseudonocardia petroleophila]
MRTRVGINGMGRIGRDVLRGVIERGAPGFDVVAVNDVAPPATIAHLLRHDSTYGRWPHTVDLDGGFLTVDDLHSVRVLQEPDPSRLDWAGEGVDVVIEATGRFRTRAQAAAHLTAGARKVVLTSPGTDVDATIVMGVNEDTYEATAHQIVSNASCTTNCATPMALVLHRCFGIDEGLITTIHSYTSDQNLLDGPHKDLRRARSAAVNIIPTSSRSGACRPGTVLATTRRFRRSAARNGRFPTKENRPFRPSGRQDVNLRPLDPQVGGSAISARRSRHARLRRTRTSRWPRPGAETAVPQRSPSDRSRQRRPPAQHRTPAHHDIQRRPARSPCRDRPGPGRRSGHAGVSLHEPGGHEERRPRSFIPSAAAHRWQARPPSAPAAQRRRRLHQPVPSGLPASLATRPAGCRRRCSCGIRQRPAIGGG